MNSYNIGWISSKWLISLKPTDATMIKNQLFQQERKVRTIKSRLDFRESVITIQFIIISTRTVVNTITKTKLIQIKVEHSYEYHSLANIYLLIERTKSFFSSSSSPFQIKVLFCYHSKFKFKFEIFQIDWISILLFDTFYKLTFDIQRRSINYP